MSLRAPIASRSALHTAVRISVRTPLSPQLACPAGCLLAPWPPGRMLLGERKVGCGTCTCAEPRTRAPWRFVLAGGGQREGDRVSPKGEGRGASGVGSCRPISSGLTLRRVGPRLRPRGGDRASPRPSQPPRAGTPDVGFDPGLTSQPLDPTASRAAHCGVEAVDPARSRAACPLRRRLSRPPAGGGRRGTPPRPAPRAPEQT